MTTEKESLRPRAIVTAAVTGVAAVGVALGLCVLIAVTGGDGLDTGQIINRGLLCLVAGGAALVVGPLVAARTAAGNHFDLGVVAAASAALLIAVIAISMSGDTDQSKPLVAVVAFTVSFVLGLAGAVLGRKR